jgi:glycosyltransferase involved in cell wall biosynthesis
MGSRVKMVMLLEDLEFGGTQRQALEIAARLDRNLFDAELWMMRWGNDFRLPPMGNGLTPIWLSQSKTVGLESLLRLAMHLRSQPIDLLLLLTAIPNIWGRLLGRLAKIPLIVATIRGEGGPFRQHEKVLWPWADHHLCNSAALKTLLVEKYRVPQNRVSVIPNGIDCHRFLPPPTADRNPGEPVILCVARLVPDKDLVTLISAFELLLHRLPSARLQLVGDGPLQHEICAAAQRRIPNGRFQWLPGRRDLIPLYQAASLFALSSIMEGFPNVVLEAMACGLPVAATRVGGLQEVVEHGRTGLLSNPRDPAALADSMMVLLDDDGKRTAFGAAGRRRALDHFSIDSITRSHERLFLQLMKAG